MDKFKIACTFIGGVSIGLSILTIMFIVMSGIFDMIGEAICYYKERVRRLDGLNKIGDRK